MPCQFYTDTRVENIDTIDQSLYHYRIVSLRICQKRPQRLYLAGRLLKGFHGSHPVIGIRHIQDRRIDICPCRLSGFPAPFALIHFLHMLYNADYIFIQLCVIFQRLNGVDTDKITSLYIFFLCSSLSHFHTAAVMEQRRFYNGVDPCRWHTHPPCDDRRQNGYINAVFIYKIVTAAKTLDKINLMGKIGIIFNDQAAEPVQSLILFTRCNQIKILTDTKYCHGLKPFKVNIFL